MIRFSLKEISNLPIRIAAVLLALCSFLICADVNPLAGTWKLDPVRSKGPVPSMVRDGFLTFPPEIFLGGSPPRNRTPNGKVPGVYKMTVSPDGRTLTMTQPQAVPEHRTVFDRQ